MAVPPRPAVRTLPPGPDVADQATFNDRANAFFPEVTPWGVEVNTLADWMKARGDEVATATPQALDARDDAQAARDAAEGHEEQAGIFASAAQAAAGAPAIAGQGGRVLRVRPDASGVEWADDGVPAGAVFHMAMDSPPPGYLRANGAAISRTTYARLFSAIGTTHGAGNGSTTFNVPDLRDDFVRGSSASRAVGVRESDAFRAHTHGSGGLSTGPSGAHAHSGTTQGAGAHNHTYLRGSGSFGTTGTGSGTLNGAITTDTTSSVNNHTHTFNTSTEQAHTHPISGSTDSTGGAETRPRNVALLAVIKF